MNIASDPLKYNSIKINAGTANAVSHILRTPITCILGFAHLLDGDNLTSKQKEYIRSIEKSAHLLLTATEHLLLELKQEQK